MMQGKILSNPEMKSAIFKISAGALIFTVLALFLFSCVYGSLNKGLLEKNIAAIGVLVSKHPELKDDIVTTFTREAGPGELQQGIAAAGEYGYTGQLPVTIVPVINGFYYKGFVIILIFSILYIAVLLALVYTVLGKFLQKVRATANAAERIIEGDFNIKLYEEDEGDFSKLGHQFNQMAKRLELSLEQLKNEKIFLKNMISDISHQLKTPLSSVKIFNEILSSGKEVDDSDQLLFIEKSREQIERMEWLIQNLLVMARIEAGAIDFVNEYKLLYPTIEAAVDSLKEKWTGKKQNVRIIEGSEQVHLLHDERWLGEAVGNIVKNGIEHTGEGGNIVIEISETPIMVKVVIRDDGEGIDETDLPHVFQRFYRGRNNTGGSGTGIGLALAKAIIENEGGMITVNSTLLKGTTFMIAFPKSAVQVV